jgi:hypothetical protein
MQQHGRRGLDFVVCPYTGRKLKRLTYNYLKSIGKSLEQIKIDFPEQQLICKTTRTRLGDALRGVVSHKKGKKLADIYNGDTAKANEVRQKIHNATVGKNNPRYGTHIVFSEDTKLRKSKLEYETKKKNGTFNTIKLEDQCYDLLKQKFPDTVHTYRDSRYPYQCDFYVPQKDLFIECQFSWTHGGEPYNPRSKEHRQRVKLWLARSQELNFSGKPKKFYLNAVNTWTKRDVQKRQLAKKNKLKQFDDCYSLYVQTTI